MTATPQVAENNFQTFTLIPFCYNLIMTRPPAFRLSGDSIVKKGPDTSGKRAAG